jgi:hypothetical protein
LWEVATGKERQRVRLPCDKVADLAFAPDGRSLAVAAGDGTVMLWSLVEGKPLSRLTVGALNFSARRAVVFSPDGRTLATVGDDTTILLWPVTLPAPSVRPAASRPDDLWAALGGADVGQAYRAMLELVGDPKVAVPALAVRVRPVATPDPQDVVELLRDLDDDEFAVRERATERLTRMREAVAPALREFLKSPPSTDSRRRAEGVLKGLKGLDGLDLSADQLRSIRAVEVLERIGTREALGVLESLAKGAASARLTQEAGESVKRLTTRVSSVPR